MNTQITLDHLSELKLQGMARAYQAVLSMPVQDQPSLNQFMARLAEAEIQHRTQKKTEMFLLQSKLRYNAVLEQVHCNANRNLSRENLLAIADCSFIERSENLLITGATGCVLEAAPPQPTSTVATKGTMKSKAECRTCGC